MSYDDDDDDGWADREFVEEEEMSQITEWLKEGFDDFPGGPFVAPCKWYVFGTFDGDIKWNNSELTINFKRYYPLAHKDESDAIKNKYGELPVFDKLSCHITPFTENCGAKSLSHITGGRTPEDRIKFLELVESFMFHKMNCGILVGSDYKELATGYSGRTGRTIKEAGKDYVILDSVWNPNYTWKDGKDHNIFLFYKYLRPDVYTDYWG